MGDGGTSALFQSMAKIRAQNHERNFTSAKLEILIFWKFLGNYMLGKSWKLYAGKFGWMPAVFLKGVIMAQCHGITLRFQGNGTRSSVEHPGGADLSRTKRSKVIGSVEQGDGDAKPIMEPMGALQRWVSTAASK